MARLFAALVVCLAACVCFADDADSGGEQKFPKWSGSGTLGYTTTGGNSRTNSLSGEFELTREGELTNNSFKAGITYANVIYAGDPIKTANSCFGEYKFEAFFTRAKKPYAWGLLGAESDEFQGYWGRYKLEIGPGYSFFGTYEATLKLEVGYALVDTNWVNPKETNEGEYHLWETTHNALARVIASSPFMDDRVTLEEEVLYRANLEDWQDYVIEATSSVKVKLNDKVSLTATLDVTYTNQPALVEKLDENGNVVTYDDDGDPSTPEVPKLVPAQRLDYTLTNGLSVSFL